jgi:hypothetical protein
MWRLRYTYRAGWSSLVARRAHNPKVVSSNLTPATILLFIIKGFWCSNQRPFKFVGHPFFDCLSPTTLTQRTLWVENPKLAVTHLVLQ